MQNVIETDALCKRYGSHLVVDHLALTVPEGCVYGFLGPNGAGKSTTMKMLLGLVHPTGGTVRLLGKEMTDANRLGLLHPAKALPVLMAVLASRLWDVEAKGCTAKLLYTLQSRRSLFLGKAVFGLGEVVLLVALEAAVLVVLGQLQGYTEAFPAGQFAYLNPCTLTVCTMLYFSELLLAIWFSNPLPAVCVGIIGALLGLSSAFMPQIASHFVPWGYFVPLGSYEVKVWDQVNRTILYGTRPCNWGLLVFTFGLAVFLFGVCWRVMRDKEV